MASARSCSASTSGRQAGLCGKVDRLRRGFVEEIDRKFTDYKKPDSALANPPRERYIQWLRPVLVAEVEFTERTTTTA